MHRFLSLVCIWIAAHYLQATVPIQPLFLLASYSLPKKLYLLVPLLVLEYTLVPNIIIQWGTEIMFNFTMLKMLNYSANIATIAAVGVLTLLGGKGSFVLPNLVWMAFIIADVKCKYSLRRVAKWLGIKLPTSVQVIIRKITKDSFSLYWDKENDAKEYQVQIDDTTIPTRKSNIKVEGLESGRIYKVIVWSVSGEIRTPSNMLFIRTEHANDEHEKELELQAMQIRKSQNGLKQQMERIQAERKLLENEHQQLCRVRKEREQERHKLKAQIRLLEDETRQKEAANQRLEQELRQISLKRMQAKQIITDKIEKIQKQMERSKEQFQEAKYELCNRIEKISQDVSKERQENIRKREDVEQQIQKLKEQKNILETYARLSGEMHQLARKKVLLMEQLAYERRKRWG